MKNLVVPGLVLAGLLVAAPAAFAQTGPDTDTCAEAQAAVTTAAALTVQFSPDVYPDNEVPTVGEVTPALLQQILADPDLGAGARAEVESAVAAFAAAEEACSDPEPTPIPTPTPTTTPQPAPTTPAPPDLDCDDVTRSEAQAILDANPADPNGFDVDDDGTACEVDADGDFDQVDVVPVGGVATGGGPA